MGVTTLSQAGRRVVDEAYFSPRESGGSDAGLRRASSRPNSKSWRLAWGRYLKFRDACS